MNANTPDYLCRVKYPDITDAIHLCMKVGGNRTVFVAKSDVSVAFCNLGILKRHWHYLVMKCKSPITGRWAYFADKCQSFGAAISCRNFQEVSDSIAHIVCSRINQDLINYLDDYFFCPDS